MKLSTASLFFSATVLLTTFVCTTLQGQTIRLYHDAQMMQVPESEARFYAECKKQDNIYSVEEYNLQHQLQFTGYITDTNNNFVMNRQGHFVYFDGQKKKINEGDFNNGAREGIWTYYLKSTTIVAKKITYGNSSIQKVVSFDSSGQLESEQYYSDGIPDKMLRYDKAGKITEEVIYESGKPISTKKYENSILMQKKLVDGMETNYYKNGKIKSEKKYDSKGNLAESHYYNEKGTEIPKSSVTDTTKTYQYVEQMPAAPYNVGEYLGEHLHYPDQAREKGIIGRVIVKFIVYEDGSINDIVILKGVHPLIDEAAIQVISEMPKWKPGLVNGKPVKVYYNQPIRFTLE